MRTLTRSATRVCASGVGATLLLLAAPAGGLSLSFAKLADTATPVPGGTGNLSDLYNPYLDGETVAFWGAGTGQQGIYVRSGGSLGVVADRSTTMPGSAVNFAYFNGVLSVDGSTVAFQGSDSTALSGVYTASGGSLNRAADTNTPVPEGTGNFQTLGIPSLEGGTVVFTARSASYTHNGIYAEAGGSVSVVADRGDLLPGQPHGFFDGLGNPSLDNGVVAFRATGGNTPPGGAADEGIYTASGGTLSTVLNRGTTMPGDTLKFLHFSDPVLDAGNLVFRGSSPISTQIGIYAVFGGSLSVLADKNTAIPEGVGNFSDFAQSDHSLSGSRVVFVGDGASGQRGIYLYDGIALSKVIDLGDTLDGKDIVDLSLGWEALSGPTLGFRATFSDGSKGLYLTTVPEPSTALLLVGGLAGLALAGHRSRQDLSAREALGKSQGPTSLPWRVPPASR